MNNNEKLIPYEFENNSAIAERGLKSNYSRQREIIYNAVIKNKVHPTADFIYSHLKESYPKLSLGTVYRNLNLLAASGKIKRLIVPTGADRYDGDTSGHYHAVCEVCGAVADLDIEYISELDKSLAAKGFEVSSHDIIFNTLCDECSQQ